MSKFIISILIVLISSNLTFAETHTEWVSEGDHRFFEQGNYSGAIEAYDKAIAIEQSAYVWTNKGWALFKLGRYEAAIKAFDAAITMEQDAFTWNSKGLALANLGRYEEAIEAYGNAIELDPNYATPSNNKGQALAILGRYDEAIEAYDKAIELNKNFTIAWFNKGLALVNLGRYEEAINAYDKVIELDQNYADAWNNKGFTLVKLGRYEDAIEAYNKAIDIEPDNTRFNENKKIAVNMKSKIGKPTGKNEVIIGGLLFLMSGVWVSLIGLKELKKAKASINWLKTNGKVISSEVIRRRSSRYYVYTANVCYEYSICGNKYSSNIVSIGRWDGPRFFEQRIVNKYPTGNAVVVHYNPSIPSNAVLKPGITSDNCFTLLFGLIFCGLGLFMILIYSDILIF
jgi:tetratricopeptide (TPR) repeat protein